jgi:hypothetical protein
VIRESCFEASKTGDIRFCQCGIAIFITISQIQSHIERLKKVGEPVLPVLFRQPADFFHDNLEITQGQGCFINIPAMIVPYNCLSKIGIESESYNNSGELSKRYSCDMHYSPWLWMRAYGFQP